MAKEYNEVFMAISKCYNAAIRNKKYKEAIVWIEMLIQIDILEQHYNDATTRMGIRDKIRKQLENEKRD